MEKTTFYVCKTCGQDVNYTKIVTKNRSRDTLPAPKKEIGETAASPQIQARKCS